MGFEPHTNPCADLAVNPFPLRKYSCDCAFFFVLFARSFGMKPSLLRSSLNSCPNIHVLIIQCPHPPTSHPFMLKVKPITLLLHPFFLELPSSLLMWLHLFRPQTPLIVNSVKWSNTSHGVADAVNWTWNQWKPPPPPPPQHHIGFPCPNPPEEVK